VDLRIFEGVISHKSSIGGFARFWGVGFTQILHRWICAFLRG
jgi:hypothetical protein